MKGICCEQFFSPACCGRAAQGRTCFGREAVVVFTTRNYRLLRGDCFGFWGWLSSVLQVKLCSCQKPWVPQEPPEGSGSTDDEGLPALPKPPKLLLLPHRAHVPANLTVRPYLHPPRGKARINFISSWSKTDESEDPAAAPASQLQYTSSTSAYRR